MNPLRAWNRFWFQPTSARQLGVYRIVFGLVVLAHLAYLSVDLDFWYTDAGLLRGDEARIAAGVLRFSPLQWIQDPVSVRVFMAGLAGVSVAFVLGWRTRIMGVLLYIGLLSLYHRNISTSCGADMLMMIVSFYLMLSPCGAGVSLDARRVARRWQGPAEPLILPWAQRLIQLQICLVYLDTAVLKCNGGTWLGGTAIHFVLFNSEFRQLDLEWLAAYPLLLNLMTHLALLVEIAFPFLIWFRPTRRWIALSGVALHAGIFPMVNVPLFGEQMIAMYILFLDRDELDTLLRAFDPRRLFRSGREARPSIPGRVDPTSTSRGYHQLTLRFDGRELETASAQAVN